MSDWSDDYTDEQIQEMKDNLVVYGLCTPLIQAVFDGINREDLIWYYDMGWVETETLRRDPALVYRLRPDWERPEKEEEKKFKIVEYEVEGVKYGDYTQHSFSFKGLLVGLTEAPDLKGFIGWKFEETKNEVFNTPVVWLKEEGEVAELCWINPEDKSSFLVHPATPKSVVFMEEE